MNPLQRIWLFLFFCFVQPVLGQENALWNEVIQAELNGETERAYQTVENIYASAKSTKNEVEQLRCFFYYAKYINLKEELAIKPILDRLYQERANMQPQNAAILELVYLDFLSDLRYNTAIELHTPQGEHISRSNYKNEQLKTYQRLLTQLQTLHSYRLSDYGPLFSFSPIDPSIQTLLDYVYDRFLHAYRWELSHEAQLENILDLLKLPPTEFAKAKISTELPEVLATTLQFMQTYEQLNAADERLRLTASYLSRLEFLKNNDYLTHADYQAILVENYNTTTNPEAKCFYLNNYVNQIIDSNTTERYPWAIEQLQAVLKTNVEVIYLIESEKLLARLQHQFVNVETIRTAHAHQATRCWISYQEIDEMQIQIYRVPTQLYENISANHSNWLSEKDDKLLASWIADRTALRTTKHVLTQKEAFEITTTELVIEPLPVGFYVIAFRAKNKWIPEKWESRYAPYLVTNLAAFTRDNAGKNQVQVLHAMTGEPLAQVNVQNGKDKFKTDASGTGTWKKNGYRPDRIKAITWVSHGNDSTTVSFYKPQIPPRKNQKSAPKSAREKIEESAWDEESKIVSFTDRKLYRPGQTVYYKAILYSQKEGKWVPVPEVSVKGTLYDEDDVEISTFTLQTNAFGSIAGELQIPKESKTGQFYIEWDEPDDYQVDATYYNQKEDEHAFWDYTDFDYSETYFNVEEYKRPTFEITTNAIEKTYQVGETMQVTGQAQTLTGLPLANTTVSYTYSAYVVGKFRRTEPMQEGQTTTDANGSFSISIPTDMESMKADGFSSVRFDLSLKITNAQGETRTHESTVYLNTQKLFLNLVPNEVKANDFNVTVSATNDNYHSIPAQGELAVFRVPAVPFLFQRTKQPDVESLTETEFAHYFPNENYYSLSKYTQPVLIGTLPFTTDEPVTIPAAWMQNKDDQFQFVARAKEANGIERSETLKWPDRYGKYQTLNNLRLIKPNPIAKSGWKIKSRFPVANVIVRRWANAKWVEDVTLQVYEGETPIPFKKTVAKDQSDQVEILSVWDNHYLKDYSEYKVLEKTVQTPIAFKTLRDYLTPGSEETWIVKLPSETPFEAVASMYDSALDQFQPSVWSNHQLDNTIEDSAPAQTYFSQRTIWSLNQLSLSFPKRFNTIFIPAPKLNQFGFNLLQQERTQKTYLQTTKTTNANSGTLREYAGSVTDEVEPLPGAVVKIVGKNQETLTDLDGNFSIQAQVGDELLVEYIGLQPQLITLADTKTLAIQLNANLEMDEVVVVAYGSIKKQSLTGSVAGVQLSTGNPGGDANIRIRGIGSLRDKAPLYIIDGVATTQLPDSTSISDITYLKPNDAVALYGNRAAEGVVIITTNQKAKLDQVKARDQFRETAFFQPQLRTNAAGEIHVNFTVPDDNTRWHFQVFAHDKGGNFGYLSHYVTAQKQLMVQTNPPRFLREGDRTTLTAVVNNLTDSVGHGPIRLQIRQAKDEQLLPESFWSSASQTTFEVEPNGATTVQWTFQIPEGWEDLYYEVVAQMGDHSDGEKRLIPVLSNRVEIHESVNTSIPKGTEKTLELTNLSNLSSEQKPLTYQIDLIQHPAFMAIHAMPYLMDYPHHCSEQTFARYFSYWQAKQLQTVYPDFPNWVAQQHQSEVQNEAATEKQTNQTKKPANPQREQWAYWAKLYAANELDNQIKSNWNKLEQFQLDNGSFPWFEGGQANPSITNYIVLQVGLLHESTSTPEPEWAKVAEKALGYLAVQEKARTETKTNVTDSQIKDRLQYWYTRLVWAKTFPLKAEEKQAAQAVQTLAAKNWVQASLFEKGILAQVAHRLGNKQLAEQIATHLQEQLVSDQTKGAYWKNLTPSRRWNENTTETHVLLSDALARIQPNLPLQEALKTGLIQQKLTKHWSNTVATTQAIQYLLQARHLQPIHTQPLRVNFPEAKTPLTIAEQSPATLGWSNVVKSTTDIQPDWGKVTVENTNANTAYAQLSWTYLTPLEDLKAANQSDLRIEKQLLLKNELTGQETRINDKHLVQVGDKITIRLYIESKQNLEYVHVQDLRAATLEPVDVLSGHHYNKGLRYYQSTRDTAMHFYIETLPKGQHILEYDTYVTYPGEFQNGHATLESMYAPEWTTHSTSQQIRVVSKTN